MCHELRNLPSPSRDKLLILHIRPLNQPLDEIVDLAKLISEPAETVTKIWNGYHQSLAATPALSAVIPYETYQKMAETGAKYPSFVVPLPRELVVEQQQKTPESEGTAGHGDGLPEQKDAKSIGAEMHFLVSACRSHVVHR